MRLSADRHYDDLRYFDVRVIGTLGLSQADVDAVAAVQGVTAAEGARSVETLCMNGEETLNLRVNSLPQTVCLPRLTAGRLPQASGECLMDDWLSGRFAVGDVITLQGDGADLTDTLAVTEYTVTGFGISPDFLNFSRGTSSIGNGKSDGFLYVLPEDFSIDYYTVIYASVEGAAALTAFTPEYEDAVKAVTDRLEAIEDTRCEARYHEVVDEAHDKVAEARQEYNDKKAEADQEIADAEKELTDAETELADAEQKVTDGERDLAEAQQKLADGEKELADGRSKLEDAKKAYRDGRRELDKGWADYNAVVKELAQKEKELADAEKELAAQEKTLAAAETKLKQGEEALTAAEAELAEGEKALQAGEAELEKNRAELEAGEAELAEKKAQLDAAEKELPGKRAELEAAEAELAEQETALEAAEAALAAQEEQLNAAEAELAAQEASLETAETELAAQEAQLQTKEAELSAAEAELAARTAQYEEALAQFEAQEAALPPETAAAMRAQLEQTGAELEAAAAALAAQGEQLTQAKAQLTAGKEELTAAQAQLSAGQKTLAENRAAFAAVQTELAAARTQLEAGKAQLAEGKAQLKSAEKQLAEGRTQLAAGETALAEARTQLAAGEAELEKNRTALEAGRAELEAQKTELETAKAQTAAGRTQLEAAKTQLTEGRAQLEAGRKELEAGKKTLEKNEQTLKDAADEIADGEKELADAEAELADGRAEVEDGKKELADARQEIEDAKVKLADGKQELSDAKAEAQEKLAEADKKITDAEHDIDDIEMPEWYVLDRNSVQDYVEYGMDAERIGNIGKVFPAIFFLVAALVSLTSMTRMVEEKRTEIGTWKALGYGRGAITAKFMLYALSACVLGSVLGVTVGSKVLPYVILSAYDILYINIPYKEIPIQWDLAVLSSVTAVGTVAAATWFACHRTLNAAPAQLMRPAPPRSGKRISLERVGFIWNRLNFTRKATFRNLFRFKKRFFMTVFGIGGCMALLLVGFGLRDSIAKIVDTQYTYVWTYDASLSLKKEADSAAVQAFADARDEITGTLRTYRIAKDLEANGVTKEGFLFVPEDGARMTDFLTLHSRTEPDEVYALEPGTAVISEKLARMLSLSVGDTILIADSETEKHPVKISAVAENYLYHYVYLLPETYEQLYGKPAEYNEICFKTAQLEDAVREDLYRDLIALDDVENITFVSELQKTVDNMMRSLDLVIWVLILSAAFLAFVVLYNLNTINITERRRELATLKVLGFYDGEVAHYVYRENILLTVIGTAAGIFLGIWLHRFVITTVEIDMLMFGQSIAPASFLWSSLLTFAFSALVNGFMFYSLRRIDMIESLKSVE